MMNTRHYATLDPENVIERIQKRAQTASDAMSPSSKTTGKRRNIQNSLRDAQHRGNYPNGIPTDGP